MPDIIEIKTDGMDRRHPCKAHILTSLYSPNLNLIERLWKFMRRKIINTKFYRTKEEFRQAILKFFENINQYKDELSSLMTLNFHVFCSQTIS